jgi:hypothetical protein
MVIYRTNTTIKFSPEMYGEYFLTNNVSIPNMLVPLGFKEDPWDSDVSIWAMRKDPEDAKATDWPKASNKKHKKQPHDSEIKSYSLMAIYEKVTRSTSHNCQQTPSTMRRWPWSTGQ